MKGLSIAQLTVGQTSELARLITRQMIADVTSAIGDDNPLHSDPSFAKESSFPEPIAPGVLTGGLISAAIGTQLPGAGTIYISQELKFLKPVLPGDTITARIEVVEIAAERNRVRLKTTCVNQRGQEVLTGEAWVRPPKESVVYDRRGSSDPVLLWTAWGQMWGRFAMAMFSPRTDLTA